MTIDIHKAIGKLPFIPKRGFVLPNMHFSDLLIQLKNNLFMIKR